VDASLGSSLNYPLLDPRASPPPRSTFLPARAPSSSLPAPPPAQGATANTLAQALSQAQAQGSSQAVAQTLAQAAAQGGNAQQAVADAIARVRPYVRTLRPYVRTSVWEVLGRFLRSRAAGRLVSLHVWGDTGRERQHALRRDRALRGAIALRGLEGLDLSQLIRDVPNIFVRRRSFGCSFFIALSPRTFSHFAPLSAGRCSQAVASGTSTQAAADAIAQAGASGGGSATAAADAIARASSTCESP
jgi:hypothetical protein